MGARIEPRRHCKKSPRQEGTTVAAIHMCITRALKKLPREGLIFTCQELAQELDRSRKGFD